MWAMAELISTCMAELISTCMTELMVYDGLPVSLYVSNGWANIYLYTCIAELMVYDGLPVSLYVSNGWANIYVYGWANGLWWFTCKSVCEQWLS